MYLRGARWGCVVRGWQPTPRGYRLVRFVHRARRSAGEESVNGQSSDCVSRRRIRIRPSVTSGREPFGPVRGGEAILRDRYRLGHFSVVLIPNTYERQLNVQSGHSKCPVRSDVSYATCDREKSKVTPGKQEGVCAYWMWLVHTCGKVFTWIAPCKLMIEGDQRTQAKYIIIRLDLKHSMRIYTFIDKCLKFCSSYFFYMYK